MSFLYSVIEDYKSKKTNIEKQQSVDKFCNILWKDTNIRRKKKNTKHIKFNCEDEQLRTLFQNYIDIEYKICRSKINMKNTNLSSVDFIRIHINNLYFYLFDKDVYYEKEYYSELFKYKTLYFKCIKEKQENKVIDCNQVKNDIEIINTNIKLLKKSSIEKKADMTWHAYKCFINKCIEKIFSNCNINIFNDKKWEAKFNTPNWDEDNLFIKYVCTSLSGYVRTKYKELKGLDKKIKRVRKNGQDKYVYMEEDLLKKHSALQLFLGNKCSSHEELKEIKEKKLTKRQSDIINIIDSKINDVNTNSEDIILFTGCEVPYINKSVIAKWADTGIDNICKITNSVYKNIK